MAASLFLGGLAFLFAVVWGAPLIRLLRAQHIGKQIRIEGPQTHMVKAGTPTMGGLMIVVPVVVISGLVALINFIVEMNQGRPIAKADELGVAARGNTLEFYINGQMVKRLTDNSIAKGRIGLSVERNDLEVSFSQLRVWQLR